MKILFYNHQGKVSGAERVVLLILKRLNRQKFEPLMVCPKEGTMAEETEKLGVHCHQIEQFEARFTLCPDKLLVYFLSFIRTIRRLRREITKNQPDLIHANTVRAGLVATMSGIGLKIPIIWHLHDELPKHPLSSLIRFFALCFKKIKLLPVSHATGKSFRRKILQIFGKHLSEKVIHNGIELEKFQTNPAHRPKIRAEFGLDESEIIIGIIGQITPRKGQLELIKTFAETQKQIPNSTLLVVGSPIFNQDEFYLEKLKATAKKLNLENRVKFIGSRADIPAVMQSLDFIVINSRSEALVLVAIEAMAGGTPIIATDVGGTTEIIEHKHNGWIVPFGDEKALIEAILTLGNDEDLRRKFAEKGREIAVAKLNVEHFISQIEEFYEDCVMQEKQTVRKNLAVQN
jgi:glycosyltransferase involved in cell wall biosynthesis